jgi:hypothetical protein
VLQDSTYDLAANPHSAITNQQFSGGGEGIRTPDPRVANAVLCQLSYTPDKISNFEIRISKFKGWLRGRDLNPRPLGYEPNELPDCSTPRQSQTKPQNSPISARSFETQRFQIRNRKSEIRNSLVGLGRVELPTSRLSGVRSNQLSYRPKNSSANPCIRISNANFAAKKSHTSHQVRSVSTVDAPEGRVASVAISIACDLLACRIMKELKRLRSQI